MSKILIAIPTYENIYPDTFKSVYQIDKGGHDVEFDFFRGYDVANARNQIGQATVDRGFDYVLMIDNDMVVPKDILINLMECQESEPEPCMVVGYALTRPTGAINNSGRTSVFKFNKRDYTTEDSYLDSELKDIRSRGINKLQIRGCGLACALIHRSVFEKMSFPWFKWIVYSNKTQLSEDLYFCEQFRGIAVPIFVDTRVKCGHIMRFTKWPNE